MLCTRIVAANLIHPLIVASCSREGVPGPDANDARASIVSTRGR